MQATAVTEIAAKSGGSAWGNLIPLVLLILVGGFFLTSRRRQRASQQERQAPLEPGAHVITTAGLHATVVESDGDDVLLEVAPDVVLRFTRGAIARILPPDSDPVADDHEAIAPDEEAGVDGSAPSDDADGTTGAAGAGSEGGPTPKSL